MPTLDAVKNAVKDLDPMEYRQFRDWFEEQGAKAWDQEF